MEVFNNSENKEFDINLKDFPFICRICLRRGNLRLLEKDLLDLFVTITKIEVRSTVNSSRNICTECFKTLEDISLFISVSKKEENENLAIVNSGMCQEYEVKTENITEECEDDIFIEGSEICQICSLTSCLKSIEEKAHLMQLFQNIKNTDIEAETNFPERNSICNKCINQLEKISLFISLSSHNDNKLKNTVGENEALKTKDYLEETAVDDSKHMIFESISGRNQVKVENNFSDLHTVIDIKEELYRPEASLGQNSRNGTEFCSEIECVENPLDSHLLTNTGEKPVLKSLPVHAEEKPFKCDSCKKSFTFRNILRKHILIHTGEKPFKCASCRGSFPSKYHLKRHLGTHTREKPFKCDCCESAFSRKSHLQIHMTTHTGEKPFKCEVCEKSFNSKYHLKRHLFTHTADKPFKCDCCESTFSQKTYLQAHMSTHTEEKPFKCYLCERTFSRKYYLQTHMTTHTGEKPFKCDCCECGFSQKSHLQTHMNTHTGQKPFKCDCCKKSFITKSILKKHLLVHMAEKPFKCESCEKSFASKYHLKMHMVTHTGEKPFKCQSCSRSFPSKCYLKRHLVTHMKEKLFKCDCCKNGYSRKPDLKAHLLTHTGEKTVFPTGNS